MNFFESQRRARKNTSYLIILFALAVIGTAIALYGVFVFSFVWIPNRGDYLRDGVSFVQVVRGIPAHLQWTVLLGTSGFMLLMSYLRLSSLRDGGGRAVAELFTSRRIESNTSDLHEKILFNVVEEMSIASGTPMPPIYVIADETGINAFAAGYALPDTILAFSSGCLKHLNRDELQGVVAHEISHVFNGDSRLNIQICGWLYGILCVSDMGRGMMGSRSRESSSRSKTNAQWILVGIILYVIGLIGFVCGRLIQAAISRQREFLADASAVQYTRNPTGIAGALKKIRDLAEGSRIQATAAGSISHFFFADAIVERLSLFETHPPLDERIRAILPSMLEEQPYVPSKDAFGTHKKPGASQSKEDFARWIQSVATLEAAQKAKLKTAPLEAQWEERVAGARALLDQLPEAIHDRLVSRDNILSIPIVLIVSGSLSYWREVPEPVSLMSELGALGVRETWADLFGMAQSIANFTCTWRLKLVEIAAPALAENVSVSRLLGVGEKFIRADARVSLFELMLFGVMWRYSERGDAARVYRAEIRKLSVLASESEDLRKVVSLCRGPDADSLSTEGLGIDLKKFARDLDSLSRLAPAAKREFLRSLRVAAENDGRVSDYEEAALRALHLALDCPEGVSV
ncbi:MAG: M48 family metallopeptidase [Bdellovibrionota bacterium]